MFWVCVWVLVDALWYLKVRDFLETSAHLYTFAGILYVPWMFIWKVYVNKILLNWCWEKALQPPFRVLKIWNMMNIFENKMIVIQKWVDKAQLYERKHLDIDQLLHIISEGKSLLHNTFTCYRMKAINMSDMQHALEKLKKAKTAATFGIFSSQPPLDWWS